MKTNGASIMPPDDTHWRGRNRVAQHAWYTGNRSPEEQDRRRRAQEELKKGWVD